LVGFDEQSKVYQLLNLLARKIILSKDIVIDETKVGYNHVRPSIQLKPKDLDFFLMFELNILEEQEFIDLEEEETELPLDEIEVPSRIEPSETLLESQSSPMSLQLFTSREDK